MSGRTLATWALGASLLLAASASQAQLYWGVDIGWSMATDASIRDNNFAQDGFICADSAACNVGGELNDIGNSPVVQGRLGYRVNPNFRFDGTVGFRGFYELEGSDAFPSNYKADIRSWSAMANAYYDFNLSWGKPYVGAGIGIAINRFDDVTNDGYAGGQTYTLPGGTTSNFAWSLTAGIAFQVSSRMMLDVGYRYIDLGDIETDGGPAVCTPSCGSVPHSGFSGKLRAHELMIGLRF
jgi:opacity protein-like surface antigen